MKRRFLGPAGIALLCAACMADQPTTLEPEAELTTSHSAAVLPVDLAGEWVWTWVQRLTFPPFAASLIFGVEPEGERTIATCHTEATIELTQTGRTFSDQSVTVVSACETKGGQSFALSTSHSLEGEILGRGALRMTLHGMVPCLLHGVARDIQDGVAHSLAGGGRCVVPGHPQSTAPEFGPPPAGTEVITSWTAVRQ